MDDFYTVQTVHWAKKNTEIHRLFNLIHTKVLLTWYSATNWTSSNSSATVNTSQKLPKLYALYTTNFSIQIYIFTWKTSRIFFWSVYLKSSSYIKSVDSIKLNSIERQVSIERWVFPSTKKSLRKTEALTKHKMWTFRSTTAINLLKGSINELSFVVALNLAIKLSGFEINLYDIVISPLLYTYQAWIRLYSCWQGDLWRCQVLQLYGFQPEELPWLLIGLALGRFLSIIFGRKRWHSCAYTWKFENQNC